MTVKPAIVVVPVLLVLALTACDPGGVPGGGTPVLTGLDCVPGEWTADLDDLANQMADYFVEAGSADEGLEGSVTGSENVKIDADGTATASDDATLVFTGTRGGSPYTMTSVRTGGFTSEWAMTGDTFVFRNSTDYTYSITTTVEFNGVTTTLPPQDTTAFRDDVEITTTCTGDVMVQKPVDSPFTTTWNRD